METELSSKNGVEVHHINYDNYDGHRHPVNVIEGTPLHEWFAESLKKSSTGSELFVNSYHHQVLGMVWSNPWSWFGAHAIVQAYACLIEEIHISKVSFSGF